MVSWKSCFATVLVATSILAQSHRHHQSFLAGKVGVPSSNMVLIADVLSRKEINIFSGLIRDDFTISGQLRDSSFNATVLAPLNAEMTKLPRKPWEDPADYKELGESAYSGEDGRKRAQENLRRFVSSHIVPKSPWESGEKVKTLAGKQVWWEDKDGKQTIQPDGIVVQSISDTVANGQIWIIAGVVES